jgi:hypothetical protein
MGGRNPNTRQRPFTSLRHGRSRAAAAVIVSDRGPDIRANIAPRVGGP